METPSKPNVLFLEDDADTRSLVQFSLEQAGINVFAVETVFQAWEVADANAIDLYLLDGLIPHGDSLELCRDLRSFAPTKPIVFYSGLAYEADIQKGIDAGATAYLVKPYSGDLAEEVLRYIHKEPHVEHTEPLFLDKQNVLETFKKQPEPSIEESVTIAEFLSTYASAARSRRSRTPRATLGIF